MADWELDNLYELYVKCIEYFGIAKATEVWLAKSFTEGYAIAVEARRAALAAA